MFGQLKIAQKMLLTHLSLLFGCQMYSEYPEEGGFCALNTWSFSQRSKWESILGECE